MPRLLSLAILLSVVSLVGYAAPSERAPSGVLSDRLTLKITGATANRKDLVGQTTTLNYDPVSVQVIDQSGKATVRKLNRWTGGQIAEFSFHFREWHKGPNPVPYGLHIVNAKGIELNCLSEGAWIEKHGPFRFARSYRVEHLFSIDFEVFE